MTGKLEIVAHDHRDLTPENWAEEILAALREIEGGATQREVSRRLGVSTRTVQRWRAKYSGMSGPEVQEDRPRRAEHFSPVPAPLLTFAPFSMRRGQLLAPKPATIGV